MGLELGQEVYLIHYNSITVETVYAIGNESFYQKWVR